MNRRLIAALFLNLALALGIASATLPAQATGLLNDPDRHLPNKSELEPLPENGLLQFSAGGAHPGVQA